jgi:hypothetical protein
MRVRERATDGEDVTAIEYELSNLGLETTVGDLLWRRLEAVAIEEGEGAVAAVDESDSPPVLAGVEDEGALLAAHVAKGGATVGGRDANGVEVAVREKFMEHLYVEEVAVGAGVGLVALTTVKGAAAEQSGLLLVQLNCRTYHVCAHGLI